MALDNATELRYKRVAISAYEREEGFGQAQISNGVSQKKRAYVRIPKPDRERLGYS